MRRKRDVSASNTVLPPGEKDSAFGATFPADLGEGGKQTRPSFGDAFHSGGGDHVNVGNTRHEPYANGDS